MNRSEQINELAAAMAKAQARIEGAAKDKTNPAFRSKYADLGAVWDAVRAPLSDNGLAVVQFPRKTETGIEVETVLMHSSGQWMSDTLAFPISKPDAHGHGGGITYARRFSLQSICGVAPVDDDGNAAAGKEPDVKRLTPKNALPNEEGNCFLPTPRMSARRLRTGPSLPSPPSTLATRRGRLHGSRLLMKCRKARRSPLSNGLRIMPPTSSCGSIPPTRTSPERGCGDRHGPSRPLQAIHPHGAEKRSGSRL